MILKNIQQLLQGNYRMSVKNIVSKLSTTEKIELYNCLYADLSGEGIGGDTELAHVNTEEMQVLRDMGGSGTVNPNTGLIQFMGGSPGGGGSAPAPSQSTIQKETIPDELKPFVTDVLEKSKALQERREEEGYVPFEGPRIASFSPEQEQAFAGVQNLQGASQPYFRTAEALTASSALAPTSASVGQFMNPFIQNVIDIQKREAERTGDVERQRIGQQAVGAGAFGGSRQGILEAEANRNLQQRLGDIQARGQAAAFEDAQNRLAQQRNRERSAGSQFASLATAVPGQTMRELTALETTGAQRRGVGQQALDIAQQEYEVARTFPERTLQDYQSIIRGYAAPIPASTVKRETGTTATPSAFQQIGGLGLAALGTAGAFGAFNKKEGGLVGLANGGKVGKYAQESNIGNPRNIAGRRQTTSIYGDSGVDPYQGFGMNQIPPVSQGSTNFLKITQENQAKMLKRREDAMREREAIRGKISPLLTPTQTQESKDYLEALKNVDFAKRRTDLTEAYDKEKDDLSREKYFALIKGGLGILGADPAGKTPLQAVASGFLDSKALSDLRSSYKDERKLLREKRKNLQDIKDKELANLAGRANLTEAQAERVRKGQIAALTQQMATTTDKETLAKAMAGASDKVTNVALKINELKANKALNAAKAAAKKADKKASSAFGREKAALKESEKIINSSPFIQTSQIQNSDGTTSTMSQINKGKFRGTFGPNAVAQTVEENMTLVRSMMGTMAREYGQGGVSLSVEFGGKVLRTPAILSDREKIEKEYEEFLNRPKRSTTGTVPASDPAASSVPDSAEALRRLQERNPNVTLTNP